MYIFKKSLNGVIILPRWTVSLPDNIDNQIRTLY